MPYLSEKTGGQVVRLLLVGMVIGLFVVGYVYYASYKGRVDLITSQRADCERVKLDRKDNSDFQRAHKKYIETVTTAASVKEDVRKAAREASETFDRTSKNLVDRSLINCKDAFPDTGLLP